MRNWDKEIHENILITTMTIVFHNKASSAHCRFEGPTVVYTKTKHETYLLFGNHFSSSILLYICNDQTKLLYIQHFDGYCIWISTFFAIGGKQQTLRWDGNLYVCCCIVVLALFLLGACWWLVISNPVNSDVWSSDE